MPAGAQAAVLEVAPVTVELSDGTQAAAITLLSHDKDPVFVQVRAFVWTQSGNDDTLKPTQDLALAPPLFNLPENTPQVVRVILQQPASDQERSYRLLIDQLPVHPDRSGVQFALRLSLPIFVEPDHSIMAVPAVSIDPAGPALVVVNRGSRRMRMIDVTLKTDAGVVLKLSGPPNPYILPGAQRRWRIATPLGSLPPGTKFRMTAKTDNGLFNAQVSSKM